MEEKKDQHHVKKNENKPSFDKKKIYYLIILGIIVIVAVLAKKMIHFNRPPEVPHSPNPVSGSVVPEGRVIFSWKSSDPDGEKVSYDLWISKDGKKFSVVAKNLKESSYTLYLDPGMKIYWKVVARDDKGSISYGPVWEFSTAENSPPTVPVAISPPPGSILKKSTVKFIWKADDPDGEKVFYDLYIDGKEVLKSATQEYFMADIEYGNHSWRVVAKDKWGAESVGGPWSFSVEKENATPTVELRNDLKNITEGTITLLWNAYDPDNDKLSFKVYLDDKLIKTTNFSSADIYLPEGEHEIKVAVSDGKIEVYKSYRVFVKKKEISKETKETKNLPPLIPFGPYPPSGGEVHAGKVRLSWGAIDYDSTILTYDLYFDGEKIAHDLSKPYFTIEVSPGLHYWKVIVKDDNDNKTEGHLWKFTAVKKKESSPIKQNLVMASGSDGIVLLNLDSGEIVDSFAAFPVYGIYKVGTTALAFSRRKLLLFNVENGFLNLEKIIDLTFDIEDVALKDKKIYAAGSGKVYLNGKILKFEGANSIEIYGRYIYIGAGSNLLVVDNNGNKVRSEKFKEKIEKVKSSGKLFVITSSHIYMMDSKFRKSVGLPQPLDIVKTKTGYVAVDGMIGLVFLDENLDVTDTLDLKGLKSVDSKDDYIIAGGNGIYLIKNMRIIKKIGGSYGALSLCGDFKVTVNGVIKGSKEVFPGKVESFACEGENWAAISYGKLFVNGKETSFKAKDVTIYKGRVYAACEDFLAVFDLKGNPVAKIGENAEIVSGEFIAAGNTLWKIGGKKVYLKGEAKDLKTDIVVVVLERGGVEIFSWNLKKLSYLSGHVNCIETKGEKVFLGKEKAVEIYNFKGEKLGEITLSRTPIYIYSTDNTLYISYGINGFSEYDITDPLNPRKIKEEISIIVNDIAL